MLVRRGENVLTSGLYGEKMTINSQEMGKLKIETRTTRTRDWHRERD